jgi:hypothetical protein
MPSNRCHIYPAIRDSLAILAFAIQVMATLFLEAGTKNIKNKGFLSIYRILK